jgi:hypothetical protein
MHTPIQKYLALTVVLLLAPMVTGAALADADAKPSNVIVRPETIWVANRVSASYAGPSNHCYAP